MTATLTYPVDGAVNVSLWQPVQWTSVANAQAYYLYIGTTVGANDVVNSGERQQTFYSILGSVVATLPAGRTLYARMWTKVAGAWCSVDSTFTAAPSGAAVLTYPTDGDSSAALTQPFQWTSVANAQAYYLYVGSVRGANDVVNTGELQQTSFLVTSLPVGQGLYARMWTKVAGVWRFVDSIFTVATPVVAVITSPGDGVTNADLAQPIRWTSVPSVQAYYLYVGTTVGAKDLVNTGETQQTSYTATNLPYGQTLYARMWTKVAGVWRYVDSTFTGVAPAVITYPANGAVGADITQPIRWTSIPNAQAYYLYVGSAPGARNLVNTGEVQQTSYTATNLPFGQTLYARMWTKVAGAWRFVDSTFTAAPPPFAATLMYPARGDITADVTLPFHWTTVAGAQVYYLYVGTTLGARDLVNTGETHSTSYFAPNLPLGQTLYARMWTKTADVWRYVDSTFVSVQPLTARLTYPADGSANADPSSLIRWTPVVNAQAYYLYVGTTLGAKDLMDTGELQYTSRGAGGLPSGQTLYARLWTKVGGVWHSVDSTFSLSASVASVSTITYPADGAVNADLRIPIQWSQIPRTQAFSLSLGTTPGAKDVADSGETTQMYYGTGLVPTGQTLYARLGTKINNTWQYVDSSFRAVAATSQDVILAFDGLSLGAAPFSTYTESGFTVSATTANWVEGSGFPAPAVIFHATGTAVGQVLVTAVGNAPFSFKSVDVYSSVTSIPYTITGLRNSTPVFTVTDTIPLAFGNFRTVTNPHDTDVIDALVITLTNSTSLNPMGLDNISLSQ